MNKLLNFEMKYPPLDHSKSPGILTLQLELSAEFLALSQGRQGQGSASHPDLSEAWIAQAVSMSDLFPDECPPSHEPSA